MDTLRAVAAAIRKNLNQMATDQILGKGVTTKQPYVAVEIGKAWLDEITSILNTAVDSPLKDLIGATTRRPRGAVDGGASCTQGQPAAPPDEACLGQ